jgi:hypothetical protein
LAKNGSPIARHDSTNIAGVQKKFAMPSACGNYAQVESAFSLVI